jgi:hypothetical protein
MSVSKILMRYLTIFKENKTIVNLPKKAKNSQVKIKFTQKITDKRKNKE